MSAIRNQNISIYIVLNLKAIQRVRAAKPKARSPQIMLWPNLPGSDSTKSRWQTAEWWSTFLDLTSKERLFISRRTRTIDDLVQWVDAQVAPSLLMIQTVHGENAFPNMANHAAGRLKQKQIDLGLSRRKNAVGGRETRTQHSVSASEESKEVQRE
jgi:hypothetical protein